MLGPCQTCFTRRLLTPAARSASISTSHTARAGCAPADTTTTAQSSSSAPQPISKRRTPTGPRLRWLGPCFGFCRRHRRRSGVSCSVRWAIYQIRWGITPTAAPTPDTGTPKLPFRRTASSRDRNWVCSSQVCGFGRAGSAQGLGRGARCRQLCAALAGFWVGALPQRKRCRAWHGREVRQRQPELQLVQATQDFSAQKDSDAALV